VCKSIHALFRYNMVNYFQRIKFLLLTLGILVFLYFDCRLLFYLFNRNYFSEVTFPDFLRSVFYGLRFDLSAICFSNALFILLVSLPYDLFRYKWTARIIKGLYIGVNSVTLLANCSDLVYFKFISKRTTFDVFQLMGGQSDFLQLLPSFLVDYWYVVVLWIMLCVLMVFGYNAVNKRVFKPVNIQYNYKIFLKQLLCFALTGGLTVLGMRGGLQLIPLSIVNAGDNVPNSSVPIVLNTPFSIMKSMDLDKLEEKKYYTEEELRKWFDPVKQNRNGKVFSAENVVVIIMESLSTEYTKLGQRKSYTPFLDSLMDESLLFTNAIANGKRSIEGIPAILSGIPSFKEPYLNTIYSTNRIQSLANLLQPKGYSASFYHGGNNGTMNFDSFAALAGFEYYGRNEYNNEKDYDGHWGIWDEPYLHYFAKQLDQKKQPFISSVFTLSAHHPFSLPENCKKTFPEGAIPILKCVAYSDDALRKFFSAAKKSAWYTNTLFVITGDHTGLSEDPFYTNPVGNFQVPLLFYKPGGNLKGIDTVTTQQIDILPSVLSYLNYDRSYFAFGQNVFDGSRVGYGINMSGPDYQLYQAGHILQYDGTRTVGFLNYKVDSLLQNNLVGKGLPLGASMEARIKAFIQLYNNSLIRNRTFVP
jgi:phosphoglycerol transferase MdoB-like AlkP superfamily enzyme